MQFEVIRNEMSQCERAHAKRSYADCAIARQYDSLSTAVRATERMRMNEHNAQEVFSNEVPFFLLIKMI